MDILSTLRYLETIICKLYPFTLHRICSCYFIIMRISVCVIVLHCKVEFFNIIIAFVIHSVNTEAILLTCFELTSKLLSNTVP